MTRHRTLVQLTRTARAAVSALVIALIVAAPAAAATPPTRTVFEPHPFVIPAGQGCSFDIRFVPTGGFAALTVYSENEWRKSVHVKVTYENMDTGATYSVNNTWTEWNVYDPTTNILVVKTGGQSVTQFVPGDVSPFGGLITTGTFYRFTGTTTNTVDFNLNRTVQFSWSGQVIDLCAALS
jgi:hypothetical protein